MNLRLICCLLIVTALISGCGGGGSSAPSKSYSSATYKVSFNYPESWLMKEMNQVEDQKTGATKIVLFHKHDGMGTPEVRELPPFVIVRWIPAPKVEAPPATGSEQLDKDIQQMSKSAGIPQTADELTAGWNEFGAENIQSRELQIGGTKAFEATAVAKPGTAFVSLFGGQLVGPDQMYRVIAIPSTSGYYEIIRVAPKDSEELVEADKIVDSLTFTP